MSSIVGIDLGTTFSAVARLDSAGRPVIVHNSQGSNITPSVVSFVDGAVVVGEDARRSLFLDPDTFGRFKRKMGSEEEYKTKGVVHTPTSLSALVLKKLREDTERQVGSIREAVVTIPANFANEAREATMAAARKAGLTVKYIINEPTAAALYYAHSLGKELSGLYAVYDLGGGTFDVSIVRVTGNDVEVVSTEGVSQLGGDDFDVKLQDMVQRKYKQATGANLEPGDYTRNDAEEDKKSLSRRDRVTVAARGSGGRINIEIRRDEFEEAISTLLAQTEMLCETALHEANVAAIDITAVILAGGSTRIPAVHKSVSRVFGREPVTFANPDEVVALGAAIYAAFKTDKNNLNSLQQAAVSKIKLTEITSKYFGTLAVTYSESRSSEELQNAILIRKGDRLPASVTEGFVTRRDDQRTVECSVTESNTPENDPRFVRVIWRGALTLPPGRPRGQEVKVTFAYDENQTMQCSFVDVSSGQRSDVDLRVGDNDASGGVDINKFIVE